jgi:hypothetical protein
MAELRAVPAPRAPGAATALLLGLIARDDMGMSVDAIRTDALSAAGLIFAAVSFGFLLRRKK